MALLRLFRTVALAGAITACGSPAQQVSTEQKPVVAKTLQPLGTQEPFRDIRAALSKNRQPTSLTIQDALNITTPEQFRKWQPLLEKIGGKPAIAPSKVVFLPQDRIRTICGMDAGGCIVDRKTIYILEYPNLPRPVLRAGFGDSCFDFEDSHEVLVALAPFRIWIHEQGHGFDRKFGSKKQDNWIDQLEAVAFEYYMAKRIALEHDRTLGTLLLLSQPNIFDHVAIERMHRDRVAHYAFERASEVLRELADISDPWSNQLANTSFRILVGSEDLITFEDVYRFIHQASHREIIQKIRKETGQLVEGDKETQKEIEMVSRCTIPRELDGSLQYEVGGTPIVKVRFSAWHEATFRKKNQSSYIRLRAPGGYLTDFHMARNQQGVRMTFNSYHTNMYSIEWGYDGTVRTYVRVPKMDGTPYSNEEIYQAADYAVWTLAKMIEKMHYKDAEVARQITYEVLGTQALAKP